MNLASITVRIVAGLGLLSRAFPGIAQSSLPPAVVSHVGTDTVVSAHGPRPLYFAVSEVSEQFGWIVDYEDPIYSTKESRDAAVPEWRRKHPGEKGLLVPSGTDFVANLGQIPDPPIRPTALLEHLVSLYNQSPNPGHFVLIRTAERRTVVSGSSRMSDNPAKALLDYTIQPDSQKQLVSEALKKLTDQCGAAAGVPIELATVPSNALSQSSLEGFKGALSCRDQLGRIMNAMPYALSYSLLYDIGSESYYLNIVPARQIVKGENGKPVSVQLKKEASVPD